MLISKGKQQEVYNYLVEDINKKVDNICIELLNDNINDIQEQIETLKQFECYSINDLQNIRNKAREKLIAMYKNEIDGLTIDPVFKNDANVSLGYLYF